MRPLILIAAIFTGCATPPQQPEKPTALDAFAVLSCIAAEEKREPIDQHGWCL